MFVLKAVMFGNILEYRTFQTAKLVQNDIWITTQGRTGENCLRCELAIVQLYLHLLQLPPFSAQTIIIISLNE